MVSSGQAIRGQGMVRAIAFFAGEPPLRLGDRPLPAMPDSLPRDEFEQRASGDSRAAGEDRIGPNNLFTG